MLQTLTLSFSHVILHGVFQKMIHIFMLQTPFPAFDFLCLVISKILIMSCSNNSYKSNGMQVGRIGCVPACGRNSNIHNVSCSPPSLHSQGVPSGRGLLISVSYCNEIISIRLIIVVRELYKW